VVEVLRSGAALRGPVVRVEQAAGVDRQAAAADAGCEPVAKCLQRGYPLVEVVPLGAREPFPVAPGGGASDGECVQRGADPLERDAGCAAGLDQRDPAQGGALITALIPARAVGGDQAPAFVEAKCGGRDTAACGQLARS
jgi:hypothetical protein